MKIRYKLTTQSLITHYGCQWKLKEWKETSGDGFLCTDGWLHCYSNPLLAILLNPIHANISNPKLFKVEVDGKTKNDRGLKEGWSSMRLVKELEVPEINVIQRIAFGILCALEVCKNENFVTWANNWLNGKDRTKQSAKLIYSYAVNYSANAIANAVANSVFSYYDFYVNAVVANSAANAAFYAIYAKKINLIKLAKKAMLIK